jgi:2-oxoglutarate ferredoxin oxidoreductase subunit delta
MVIVRSESKTIAPGECVASCPCGVLGLAEEVNGKGYHFATMVNADDCTGCASCAIICPDTCITVYRQKFE